MIRSSITVSLVPEAQGGPFVFSGDLAAAAAAAARLGFDAIEIFPAAGDALEPEAVRAVLEEHDLALAAVGTGAGWLRHRLHLTDRDPQRRRQAREFIAGVVDFAGALGAPVIVGSMQGRLESAVSRTEALRWLGESLSELGDRAEQHGTVVLYEPLNRYETNLLNRTEEAVAFVRSLQTSSVRLLADLFHMNIEEQSIPEALRQTGPMLGHLHFVDSNRRAAGLGHIAFGEIVAALRDISYGGFVSAEALPEPSPEEAARQTMAAFEAFFGANSRD